MPALTFGWSQPRRQSVQSSATIWATGSVRSSAIRSCCGSVLKLDYPRGASRSANTSSCATAFLGRFVALLRILAAFLAGVNRMEWPAFLLANALGGVTWAALFAFGGYTLGTVAFRLQGVLGPILLVAAAIAFFGCGFLIQRYEDRLQEAAERALPGPLT